MAQIYLFSYLSKRTIFSIQRDAHMSLNSQIYSTQTSYIIRAICKVIFSWMIILDLIGDEPDPFVDEEQYQSAEP